MCSRSKRKFNTLLYDKADASSIKMNVVRQIIKDLGLDLQALQSEVKLKAAQKGRFFLCIKKSRHEPDNSSDRGHPNPNKWNTSIVLCAKIGMISENRKYFSDYFKFFEKNRLYSITFS